MLVVLAALRATAAIPHAFRGCYSSRLAGPPPAPPRRGMCSARHTTPKRKNLKNTLLPQKPAIHYARASPPEFILSEAEVEGVVEDRGGYFAPKDKARRRPVCLFAPPKKKGGRALPYYSRLVIHQYFTNFVIACTPSWLRIVKK